MEISGYFPYVLIGSLTREFYILEDGNTVSDICGGDLIYAAVGLSPWEKNPGFVSRISPDYPEAWLRRIRETGFDISGISRTKIPVDQRNFTNQYSSSSENFMSAYFESGNPFPKELLGYRPEKKKIDDPKKKQETTILEWDIPGAYLEARCIHFCPMDFLTHYLIPQVFNRGGVHKTITIQAGDGYMHRSYYEQVKQMIRGLSCFILKEEQLRQLFSAYYWIRDTFDMIRTMMEWGADQIVVQMKNGSWVMAASDGKLYRLQPYPTKITNHSGELSAFCGGFITGLNDFYDPVRSLLRGAAIGSIAGENIFPFSCLNTYPDLIDTRISILKEQLERID